MCTIALNHLTLDFEIVIKFLTRFDEHIGYSIIELKRRGENFFGNFNSEFC